MSDYKSHNKVLLVEDNPGDARLVELLLEESDLLYCKITTKTSLKEAIDELEVVRDYAAILLDLSLPDSRGFGTLDKLLAKFPNKNIIVLTGIDDKKLGLKAVKAGAQDFLIKGEYDANLLAKSLRYSIERSTILKRQEETQRIAHVGNWEANPENAYFYASDEVYRIFGLVPRTTTFSYEQIQQPGHPFNIFYKLQQDVIVQKKIKKDIRIRHSSGDQRTVFVQCETDRNTADEAVFYGVVQDISERKSAEQELLKSQERYQDIFNKSKDAIYICNVEGRFVDYNPATIELLGYTKEELNKIDIHSLFFPREIRHDFLLKLVSRKSVRDFPIEIKAKDGIHHHCLITASMLDAGDMIGYTGIIRDRTEQKQAEELRKSRDLAHQSAKMKEQFIASISHEMRTPMNAILGMSNLVMKTSLSEEQYNFINSIKQSSEILLGVVNDILEISTIQNGQIKFENTDFNLYELLASLVNVMQYKVNEKNLAFELTIDPTIPKILKGDKLRLNQVLYNLIGNAIKFTDEGYVKVKVDNLNESANSIQIKFAVEDSGIGIPEDKIDAVFETFTRIRQKDRIYEGTGLGLSIAKNLVEQQGGKIGAISSVGKGAKFYFDLIFEVSELTVTKNIQDKEVSFDVEKPIKLLLVEDHKMNQLVAKKTLERQWNDIEIVIAENGKLAVEAIQKQVFDIVLMDIQMPVMDGYEATQIIRQMPAPYNSIPILAMTAHAHISKDEKFKTYGLDDYVLKPFEPKLLFEKIIEHIQKRKKQNTD